MRKTATSKRILSLLLALVLAFSLVSQALAVEAGSPEPIKYVSLGDSMTNGYGLDGYLYDGSDPDNRENKTGAQVNGYLQKAGEAYPALFAEALGIADENFTQLAISCTRAEDLNFILHFDATDADQVTVAGKNWAWDEETWFDTFEYGDKFTWDEFTTSRWNDFTRRGLNVTNLSGTVNVAAMYQNSVAEADIVSMSIGNSNFGVFLLRRLLALTGMFPDDSSWIHTEDAFRSYDEDIQKFAGQVEENIANLLKDKGLTAEALAAGGLNAETPEKLARLVMYTVASYMVNYAQCVDRIVELNPDVELMLVGLMNNMEGVKLDIGGTVLDVGEIVGMCTTAMNAYLAGLPTVYQLTGKYEDATIYFVEVEGIEAFTAELAAGNTGDFSTVRERMIEEAQGYGIISDVTDFTAFSTKVEAYETALEDALNYNAGDLVSWAANNSSDAKKVATYYAFEKAVEASCTQDTLNYNAILQVPAAMADPAALFIKLKDDVATETAALAVDEDNKGIVSALRDAVKNIVFQAAAQQQSISFAEIQTAYTNDYPVGTKATLDGQINNTMTQVSGLVFSPAAMVQVVSEDTTLTTLLNLFGRFIAGTGIGSHPSAAGHATIAAAMVNAYTEKTTSGDYLDALVLQAVDALKAALDECAADVSSYAWDFATNSAEMNALDASIKALNELMEDDVYGLNDDLMDDIKQACGAVKGQLEALCAELKKQEAPVKSLCSDAYAQTMTAIAEAEAALDKLDAAVAAVNVAVEDLYDTAVAAVDTVEEQLPNFVQQLKDADGKLHMDTLVKTLPAYTAIVGAVEPLESKVKAVEDAVEALSELVNVDAKAVCEQVVVLHDQLVATHDANADAAVALLDTYYNNVLTDSDLLHASLGVVANDTLTKLDNFKNAGHAVYEAAIAAGEAAEQAAKDYVAKVELKDEYKATVAVLATAVEGIRWALNEYPDAPETAWKYAEKKGYIDDAVNALTELGQDYIDKLIDLISGYNKVLDTQLAYFSNLMNADAAEADKAAAAWAQIETVINFVNDEMDKMTSLKAALDEVVVLLNKQDCQYAKKLAAGIETAEKHYDALETLVNSLSGDFSEKLDAVKANLAAQDNEYCKKLAAAIDEAEKQLKNAEAAKAEAWDKALALNEKIEAALDDAKVKVEAAKAEAEAKLAAAQAEAKAQIEAEIAKAEELLAKLEEAKSNLALLEATAVSNAWKVYTDAVSQLDDVTAELKSYDSKVADVLATLVGEAKDILLGIDTGIDETKAAFSALLEDVYAAFEEALYDATHTGYVLENTNYYVALGGSTVNGDGISREDPTYVDLLAAKLDALVNDKREIKHDSFVDETASITGGVALVEANAEAIAQADMISYQPEMLPLLLALLSKDGDLADYMPADELALAREIMAKVEEIVETDVSKLTDEKLAELEALLDDAFTTVLDAVASALDMTIGPNDRTELKVMYNKLVKAFVEQISDAGEELQSKKDSIVSNYTDNKTMIKGYLNQAAYVVTAYVMETVKTVTAIKAVNPDAEVILVGLYNPVQDLTVEGFDVSAVLDYIVEASNIFGFAYGTISGDATFVDISDTTTDGMGKDLNLSDFSADTLLELLNGLSSANAEGHAYIAQQIYDALVTSIICVTGVELDKTEVTIEGGSTETLVATVAPENAAVKSVTWTSSDEDIATVDENGVVTAVKGDDGLNEGTATITATTDGITEDGEPVTATCEITVTPYKHYDLSWKNGEENDILVSGSKRQLVATAVHLDQAKNKITWTVVDGSEYASVSSTGFVTAKAVTEPQTVTVRAQILDTKSADYMAYGEYTLTVIPTTSEIWFLDAEDNNVTGETYVYDLNDAEAELPSYRVIAKPDGHADCSFKLKVSGGVTAEINEYGVVTVTGILQDKKGNDKTGTATLTVTDTVSKKSASVKISVVKYAKTVTLIAPDDTNVTAGKSVKLAAYLDMTTVKGKNASDATLTNKKIVWTVSGEGADWVKLSNGKLSVVKTLPVETSVTVTAAAEGGEAYDTCEFTLKPVAGAKVVAIQAGSKDGSKFVTAASYDYKEGSVQLSAARYDDGEKAESTTTTWASSSKKVATVDANGKVTFVAPGKVKITATVAEGRSKKTGSVTITVTKQMVDGVNTLKVAEGDVTVIGGKTQSFSIKVDKTVTNKNLIWSMTGDTEFAKLSKGSLKTKAVTAEKTIVVTASAADGSVSYSWTVTVTPKTADKAK